MRMVMWSVPRPHTMNSSALSPGSTERARFRSSSFSSRALMFREVMKSPSCPANGLVFTRNFMRTVGFSTSILASGLGIDLQATVSPIEMSCMPTKADVPGGDLLHRLPLEVGEGEHLRDLAV